MLGNEVFVFCSRRKFITSGLLKENRDVRAGPGPGARGGGSPKVAFSLPGKKTNKKVTFDSYRTVKQVKKLLLEVAKQLTNIKTLLSGGQESYRNVKTSYKCRIICQIEMSHLNYLLFTNHRLPKKWKPLNCPCRLCKVCI